MRLSLLGLAAAGLAAAAAGAAGMPPAPLPVLALTGGNPNVLVALDPRTLTPRASPRPLKVGTVCCSGYEVAPELSPNRRQVAVVTTSGLLVVDRRRFRVLRRINGEGYREALGAFESLVWSRGGAFLGVSYGGKLGLDIFDFGGGFDSVAGDWLPIPDGLLVLAPADDNGGGILLSPYGGEGMTGVALPIIAEPYSIAVDSHHRRLFVVSGSGKIAIVSLKTSSVQYRVVPGLPDRLAQGFRLAWAGGDHIALVAYRCSGTTCAEGGLSLIDTRNWSVQQVDPNVTDVAPAPGALIAWNRTMPTGITAYRPDGSVSFHALAGEEVHSVGVTARYAYADTAASRFSIDLRTGQVTGPLSSRTRLILPDLGLLDLP